MSSLSGCKGSSHLNDGNQSSIQNEVSFEVLMREAHSGFQEPSEILITNQDKLQEVYRAINKTRLPGIEAPDIDFSTEMLIIACMGQKSTGGYSITVEKILKTSEKTTVYLSTSAPEGLATMVITSPFILFKLPKQDQPVEFEYGPKN